MSGWRSDSPLGGRRSSRLYERLLGSGKYRSIGEMAAAAENPDRGYLGQLLQLTLLAPDLIQAIMDGREPAGVTMTVLMDTFPVDWRNSAPSWRAHNPRSSGNDRCQAWDPQRFDNRPRGVPDQRKMGGRHHVHHDHAVAA